ncbi:MAG TPA: LysM peptidoglycan-binding domain-containing protein [Longimicrobiales bacterium]|nr:LysM peptidoglycan-binding domain-containing protein [Longimicrobiales bacterium]
MGLFDKKPDEKTGKTAGNPRADFSNVEGSSSSTAESTPRPGAEPERTYTVASGDSLSRIAERELGDASRWRSIYEANRDEIKDPDRIFPGQVLKLPKRD